MKKRGDGGMLCLARLLQQQFLEDQIFTEGIPTNDSCCICVQTDVEDVGKNSRRSVCDTSCMSILTKHLYADRC